ncbi:MAG TPA: sugar phosphate isomerase/epimerase family protein [Phototrophicaceae bacterium]|jgi:D-psicose/D-tagatose/L-ribulose 3-epimerase|nr:sugar phosphate isomerase/epimerase family protein [Phototrophicaceae bacterium]
MSTQTFGAHAFVWIGAWDTASGNHAIAEAGKVGFDFIEIPLLNPATFDAASHRAALKQAGISSTCSLVLPKGTQAALYPDKARAFLRAVLEQVEALECQYLGGCIGYELGTLTGKPPTDAERGHVIDVMKDIAADAKQRGITLALEACNRYETYLYNTLADTRDTILATGADNLKLHADTYHMNIEEEGFYQALVDTADVLDYIHMSESHRGLVGTGTVIWDQVWRGLKDANFTGKLVLESFAAINPELAAATCLWRPPNQGPEILAREGLKFLKAGVEKYGL